MDPRLNLPLSDSPLVMERRETCSEICKNKKPPDFQFPTPSIRSPLVYIVCVSALRLDRLRDQNFKQLKYVCNVIGCCEPIKLVRVRRDVMVGRVRDECSLERLYVCVLVTSAR